MIIITKPTMDSRELHGTRVDLVEQLDTCPQGSTAALSDGSRWQACVTIDHEPLWSQYAGPGCCSRLVSGSALASRAVNLDGED